LTSRTSVSRALKRLSRPVGAFNAERYFRGDHGLRFYNVGTPRMRALARSIYDEHRHEWSIDDALRLANRLIEDPYLETKAVAIEIVARYRRDFAPTHLEVWKRWLAGNHSANWATTDAICGTLIGPLLSAHPELIPKVQGWSRHRNLWVRRASAVGLLKPMSRGYGLDAAYDVALDLHGDKADLIQKAVGWMLRDAGKYDAARLERHLRRHGASIPRTTVRYAIERFPAAKRRALLEATRTTASRASARL
jgi:3-methyladenine DNA glycosylase AlkD